MCDVASSDPHLHHSGWQTPGMAGRLDGRRALITGGANGLGAAIAVLFGSEGAQVVIADLPRTADAATSVVTAIRQAGGIAHFVEIDVRDATTARAAVDQAAGLMSGIDTVVASAGVGAPPQSNGSVRQLLDVDIDGFDLVMDINLRGVFVVCQRAAQPRNALQPASIRFRRPPSGC